MLILTRRVGESIIVGDDIEIKLTEIKGGQARIGIKAPDSVNIRRAELEARSDVDRRTGRNMLPAERGNDKGGRRGN